MAALDRILEGIKQVLMMTEEIKRLSESVKMLGLEVRDIDRRVARLEGVVVGQTQAGARKRLSRRADNE
jgi:vacuolar-type H+-ATPase subunit D/Vma8